MGEIAPKTLYRSSHPIFNGRQVKDIIFSVNNAKIKTIINLSDSFDSIKAKVNSCPWYKELLEGNNVKALNMDMNFDIMQKKFAEKVNLGIRFMIEHDPPYLIHCQAGIDRTGLLSIILESFMGACFEDIAKDYCLSFNDQKTGTVFVYNLFSKLKSELKYSKDDLSELSTRYLMQKTGLNLNELVQLKTKLRNISI